MTKQLKLPPIGLASIAAATIVLIVVGVALDRAAVFGLKQLLLHSKYRYMRVYRPAPPAHYLVIGNSRAGVHFPTSSQRGAEFFNLGNGGMGVAFAAALANDYVDQHGPPKVAIIEMSFITDPRLGEDAAGLTRVFSERARAIERDVSAFQSIAERAFQLLRFNHPTLLNALVGLVWERPQRAVAVRVNEATIKHIEELTPIKLMPTPANVERMAKLISELRQAGIAVVCVLSPILPQWREKTTNLDDYVAATRSLAQSNGAIFINDVAAISDPALFSDAAHLNAEGVAKFNRIFFAQLAARRLVAPSGDRMVDRFSASLDPWTIR
ncbi:MAG: hypothetical protein R3D62_14965 [Xanthobacteraceae bacterium]